MTIKNIDMQSKELDLLYGNLMQNIENQRRLAKNKLESMKRSKKTRISTLKSSLDHVVHRTNDAACTVGNNVNKAVKHVHTNTDVDKKDLSRNAQSVVLEIMRINEASLSNGSYNENVIVLRSALRNTQHGFIPIGNSKFDAIQDMQEIGLNIMYDGLRLPVLQSVESGLAAQNYSGIAGVNANDLFEKNVNINNSGVHNAFDVAKCSLVKVTLFIRVSSPRGGSRGGRGSRHGSESTESTISQLSTLSALKEKERKRKTIKFTFSTW